MAVPASHSLEAGPAHDPQGPSSLTRAVGTHHLAFRPRPGGAILPPRRGEKKGQDCRQAQCVHGLERRAGRSRQGLGKNTRGGGGEGDHSKEQEPPGAPRGQQEARATKNRI